MTHHRFLDGFGVMPLALVAVARANDVEPPASATSGAAAPTGDPERPATVVASTRGAVGPSPDAG